MSFLQDTELFKSIKALNIAPVYFLYGNETYFVNRAVEEIIKKTVSSQFESFNLQRINGEKPDFNLIEDAVEALPMMTPRKCVIIKDMDIEKLSKADFEKLTEIVSNPNETTVLIFYTTNLDMNIKKSSKLKKFSEAVAKIGIVCEFALKDKLTLKRALCEKAKKAYVELDMQTAEYLIDRCSQQYSVLNNELDKLIAYVGEGEITKKHIDECTIEAIDSSAFDLAKSILNNNFNKAYKLLDELFFQRQEAVSILSALSMAFSDLYRAKTAVVAKKTVEQVSVDFNYPKNRLFAIKNAFRDVESFSFYQIRCCINAMYKADILLKSSKLDSRLVLEQMLGEMLEASIKERAL